MPMYSRNAIAAVIVVDVTRKETADSLDAWLGLVRQNCAPSCGVFIAANKMDLMPMVSLAELEKRSKSLGAQFFKVSAKDFESVSQLFDGVAEVVDRMMTRGPPTPLTPQNSQPSTDKSCCTGG
jgi:signal recognition particle receptor subunit beta